MFGRRKKEEEKENEKQRYGIYICLDYVWNTSMEKVYGMVWNFGMCILVEFKLVL